MTGGIRQAVRLLFTPGQVIEVRAISDDGVASGYFDDPEQLASQVATLDGLPGVQGIYVTLNEVNPALLARRANRIRTRLSKKDATTADADILRRRWFPVDVDPVRPSGVSSTDAEHQAALDTAVRVADYLDGMGWPAPVAADSGNGAHLLYRIDLPNDDEARDLVKRCLGVLAALFDDDRTTIDPANHNAARIWKLYGTVTRKGDTTGDRPHRRSRILPARGEVTTVSRQLLEQLAAAFPATPQDPAPPRARGAPQPLILADWLRDHGFSVRSEKPYQGGTLFVLDRCPFSASHRDGAFAIQFGNGAIHAGCHHASCGGGTQRWQELRERYEPRAGRTPKGPPGPAPGSRPKTTPPLEPDELPGLSEALATLQQGDPKQAMLCAFALDHEGDEVVAECMVMSLASRAVLNTNGLHVSVTGESGKGKSHTFATMQKQVPARHRLPKRISNKALFYLEGLQPGSVIVLDDRALTEDMAEILKGVTTSFREPFDYLTVSKDRKGTLCIIPERCIWWVAKVEGVGDDQVFNRMLTCWIDDTGEQDARVLARILARDQEIPHQIEDERPEVLVCRAMWEIAGQQRFHVIVPFATRIRFQAATNRRNPEMLLDLIKSNTVLRFMQREQQRVGSVICLTATLDDFGEATRLYGLLNGTAGGQQTKLTKRESDLLAIIQERQWPEFTVSMLQKASGWSSGNLHKTIHGHTTRGKTYSGLLEKCPAIAYCDRTVVTDDEVSGVSMRRRTNAYTFDRELFVSWCAGGAVWLDDPGSLDNTSTSGGPLSKVVEVFGNDVKGSDSPNIEYNNNNYVRTHDHFHKSGITASGKEDACAPACDCDSHVVEVQKSNPEQQPSISDANPQESPPPLPQTTSTAVIWGSVVQPAAGPPGQPPRIHATDYKPLDVPEHTPCFVCSAPWSHHIEKLTGSRKARQKDQQQARRICKACYRTAKVKAQQAATVLPGAFAVSRLERLKFPVGRCTVCELDTAVYIDRSTDAKICEVCYQRAIQPRDQGEVAG